jgi:hypothetical protein
VNGWLRDLCRGLEAIINGMFGILLCVMIGLLPLLSLERQLPWMPEGHEGVIILRLAWLSLEGVNSGEVDF